MAPIAVVLAIALLALGGVNAKRKDKVSYSQFIGASCDGHPLTGGLSDLELRNSGQSSDCHSISAGGIRFHKHRKNKYNKWVDKVNSGMLQCYGSLYNGFGCHQQNHVRDVPLPRDFENCNPISLVDDSSLRFWCEPNRGYNGSPVKKEVNLPVTSYSIAADGKAHPSVHTTLFNATQHVYRTDFDATENGTAIEDADHADLPHEASLQPRGKHNIKGKWMKHPWTGSLICYQCWTKHNHGDKFRKFLCRSGNHHKYDIDCGPKPELFPPVTLHPITRTTTMILTRTSTLFEREQAQPTAALEKRSRHKRVTFQNPWLADDVCADAEWENEGDHDAEVRLQHTKKIEKCYGDAAFKLDPYYPRELAQPGFVATVFIMSVVRIAAPTGPPSWTKYTVPVPVTTTTYVYSPSTYVVPSAVVTTVHRQVVATVPTMVTTHVLSTKVIATPTVVVTNILTTVVRTVETTVTVNIPTTITRPIPTVFTSYELTTTTTAVPVMVTTEVLTTINQPVLTVITTNVLTSSVLAVGSEVVTTSLTTVTWPIDPVGTDIPDGITPLDGPIIVEVPFPTQILSERATSTG